MANTGSSDKMIPLIRVVLAITLALTCVNPQTSFAEDTLSDDDFESSLFGDRKPGGEARGREELGTQNGAQGSDAAAFDTLLAAGSRESADYLVGGTVVVSAAFSSSEAVQAGESGARGKLFGKVSVPRYGSLFVSYFGEDSFFQGYSGPSSSPMASEPHELTWNLSEFHYSFDVGKRAFVRLGRQLISWGPSRVWTPVDFINLERSDFFTSLDARVGKPGLRLHVPFRRGNAFVFSDFSGVSADGRVGNPYKAVNTGARIDVAAGGAEFGLTAYGGYAARSKFGLDASGRVLSTSVYGELAYTLPRDGRGDSILASLGFSRALDERKLWVLSAEGLYNSMGEDLSGLDAVEYAALPEKARVPLYQGTWYAYAALSAQEFLSPYLNHELSVLTNAQERSVRVRLAETLSFPGIVPVTLSAYWAGGKDSGEFTRRSGANAFGLEARVSVSF